MTKLISLCSRKNGGKDLVGKIIQCLLADDKETTDFLFSDPWSALSLHTDPNKNWSGNYDQLSQWQIRKFAFKLKKIICELTGCSMEDLENPVKKEEPLGEEWRYYQAIDVNSSPYGSIFDNSTDCQRYIDNQYRMDGDIHLTIISKVHSLCTLMQIVGTDAGRNLITPRIWINATFADYNLQSHWILTDTRFLNEVQRVKQHGGIAIKIVRYKTVSQWFADVSQHVELINEHLLDHIRITTRLMTFESFLDLLPTIIIETKPTYNDWFSAVTHYSEVALADYDQFDFVLHNDCTIQELIERVKQILIQAKLL